MRPFVFAIATLLLSGCARQSVPDADVQTRGAQVMGVNQDSSSHVFDDLPDGGRITYRSNSGDVVATETIRRHLAQIAAAFADGDFSAPFAVHDTVVPGTDVMRARRHAIRYEYADVERGGAVRLRTTDADALRAIHAFMAFQRADHRARGRVQHHGH